MGAFAMRRLDDPDTWWHLAGGRYIASHWAIPTHDVFSFTAAQRPWIDLQWLFDLGLFGAYTAGGVPALLGITAVLAMLAYAILLLITREHGWIAATGALGLALLISQDRFVPRPEMCSLVLFAGYLALLEAYPGNGRWIWTLLPLQVLWVNLHGIFIVGLVLIAAYAIGRTLAGLFGAGKHRAGLARLWAVAGSVALLSVVNPYGVRGALFPFTLLTRISTEKELYLLIGEFHPPFEGSMTPVLWCYVALIGISGASFLLHWRATRWDRLLAWGAFLTLSVMARRNMPLFAVVAAPAAASGLAALGQRLAARRALRPWWGAGRTLAATALGLALAGLIFAVVTNRFFWWLGERREFGVAISTIDAPIGAAEFLERYRIGGRGFNDLHSGGYLIWRGSPERQVFIDGRLEVYDETFFARYRQALAVPDSFDSLTEQYGFEYVVMFHGWENRWPLITYLTNSDDWALVYVDQVAVVFIRNRSDNAALAQAVVPELRQQLGNGPAAATEVQATGWWPSLVWPLQLAHGHMQKGNILSVLGQHTAASREFEAALRVHPEFLDARLALGYARWNLGQHDAARAEWRRALVLDPEFEPARLALQEAATESP